MFRGGLSRLLRGGRCREVAVSGGSTVVVSRKVLLKPKRKSVCDSLEKWYGDFYFFFIFYNYKEQIEGQIVNTLFNKIWHSFFRVRLL